MSPGRGITPKDVVEIWQVVAMHRAAKGDSVASKRALSNAEMVRLSHSTRHQEN